EIKGYFTYRVPKIDLMVGANYLGLSGSHFAPTNVYSSSQLSVGSSSRRTIFLEPRGSRENDFRNQIDLRLEKVFQQGANRFGVYADTINLFNDNTVTTRQSVYPSSGGIAFLAPTGVLGARQVTFGLRWSF